MLILQIPNSFLVFNLPRTVFASFGTRFREADMPLGEIVVGALMVYAGDFDVEMRGVGAPGIRQVVKADVEIVVPTFRVTLLVSMHDYPLQNPSLAGHLQGTLGNLIRQLDITAAIGHFLVKTAHHFLP